MPLVLLALTVLAVIGWRWGSDGAATLLAVLVGVVVVGTLVNAFFVAEARHNARPAARPVGGRRGGVRLRDASLEAGHLGVMTSAPRRRLVVHVIATSHRMQLIRVLVNYFLPGAKIGYATR